MVFPIPSSAIDAGMPFSDGDSIVLSPILQTGEDPDVFAEDELFGQNLNLAPYTVVGRVTATGAVIPSVMTANDGSQNPIGFTAVAVVTGAGATAKAAVYRSGCFNPNALVWDATFATDENKRLAFRAAAPLIVIKAPVSADI